MLEGGETHVELSFAELSLEDGFDFVRVYSGRRADGSVACPPGYNAYPNVEASSEYLYSVTGSSLPDEPLVFEGDLFVVFESDGLVNAGATRDGSLAATGGFGLAYRALRDVDREVCAPGFYGANCAIDHCVGDQRLAKALAGRIKSGDSKNYLGGASCRWIAELPDTHPNGGAPLVGVSIKALDFDLEDSTGHATTTDALKVYFVGDEETLFSSLGDPSAAFEGQTLAAGDEVSVVGASPGKANLVFAFSTDKNNASPKRGFDVRYAAYYGDDVLFCDDEWPCPTTGLSKCALNKCVAPSSGGTTNEVPLAAILVPIFAFVLMVAGFFFYRRKKIAKSRLQKKVIRDTREELQQFRESVIGMRCVVNAAGPTISPSDVAVDVHEGVELLGAASAAKWSRPPARTVR